MVEEVFLARHVGRGVVPDESNFGLRACNRFAPEPGDIRVRTLYIAISLSLRFSLNPDSAQTCSAGGVAEETTLCSDGVGLVIETQHPSLAVGDLVASFPKLLSWPWRSEIVFKAASLAGCCYTVSAEGRDADSLAMDAIGCAGLTGMTSFFGIRRVLRPRSGETVVISAVAGACGSVAGQLANFDGARVIGITSSEAKAEHAVGALGLHAAIVHTGKTAETLADELSRVCPHGIDCYFDNVGGCISHAVARCLRSGLRVAICGAITDMAKSSVSDQGWVDVARSRGACVQWFRYTSYLDDLEALLEARAELLRIREAGTLTMQYTLYRGLGNAPACFADMFRETDQMGKRLVQVSACTDGDSLGVAN